jgi:hypothetical protein
MKKLAYMVLVSLILFPCPALAMNWLGKNNRPQHELLEKIVSNHEDMMKHMNRLHESLDGFAKILATIAHRFEWLQAQTTAPSGWHMMQQTMQTKLVQGFDCTKNQTLAIARWILVDPYPVIKKIVGGAIAGFLLYTIANTIYTGYRLQNEFWWSTCASKLPEIAAEDLLIAIHKRYVCVEKNKGKNDGMSYALSCFMEQTSREKKLLEYYENQAWYMRYTPARLLLSGDLLENIPKRLSQLDIVQEMVRTWFAQQAIRG